MTVPELKTSENYQLAKLLRRVYARTIDIVLIFFVSQIVWFFVFIIGLGVSLAADSPTVTTVVGVIWATFYPVSALLIVLYEPFMVARYGRTIGKIVAKIHIIRVDDGGVPTWKSSFIRWGIILLIWGVIGTLVVSMYIPIVGQAPTANFGMNILESRSNTLILIAYLLGLSHLLSCLGSNRRQGWHDRAARTVVIRTTGPRPSRSSRFDPVVYPGLD